MPKNSLSYLIHSLFSSFASGLKWGLCVAVGALMGLELSASEISELERRERLHELYQRQIPLLEQFVRNHERSEQTPANLFRLGEAYFESAKYYQLKGNQSRTTVFFQRAIQALEKLRTDFPLYERADEALFVLSSAYLETSRNAEAGGVLAEIARRFPQSPIMTQAAYLLGDHFYSQDNMTEAKKYYEMASQIEESKVYGHYRLAWVALRQGQAAVSLRHFVESIRLSSEGSSSNYDYSKDAAREMVWPALEVHRPQQVIRYLQSTLPNKELLEISLNALAMGSMTKEDYRLASQIFDVLTQDFQDSARFDSWMKAQLEAEEKLGRSDRIVDLVSRLSEREGNSTEIRTQIYTNAKKYHALAQAEKDPKVRDSNYDQAIAYYQAFVKMGEDLKTQETQFYLGEALYTRGRYEEAVRAYQASVQGQHEKQQDAAWNWYHTAEKLAPGFRYEGESARPLQAKDEEFLTAARFVASADFMPEERRRTASYQSARLLYQLNQHDQALPLFQQLAERFPQTKEGQMSAQLVLDIHNLKGDYRAVAQYARDLRQQSAPAEAGKLAELEAQALFKSLQAEERQAREFPERQRISAFRQMSQRYLQYARQYPEAELAPAGLWAALQLSATVATFEGDRRFTSVRELFDLLRARYSNTEFMPRAVDLMGEFLAHQQPEVSALHGLEIYREAWLKQMRQQPAAERGLWGSYLYELSSESQKKALLKEFSTFPVSAENRKLIAKYRFSEVEEQLVSYRDVSLNQLSSLAKNTQEKLKRLERLESSVKAMVELGDPKSAVASLDLLAVAYAEMGQAFREAPVPDSLEPEQLQQYRQAVEEKARDYDLEARKTRELSRQTARRLGI